MIRDARPDERDYDAFARMFPELGVDDPLPDAERWNAELAPHTFFVMDGEEHAAYGYVQHLEELGYIRHVIVDRDHRRRGYGRRLMEEARARFVRLGCKRWCLNVKPDNAAAIRLYESVGMKPMHTSAALRMGWDIIERLDPGDDATTREPAYDEHTAIEKALGMKPGLAAAATKNPRAKLRIAERVGACVGFASFDPGYPGCYPFRAIDVPAAHALLADLRTYQDPSHTWIQLVFENAQPLVDAFLAAGARTEVDIVHYEGPL